MTELTANIIAQNMYAMCDAVGHQLLVFEAIVDHQRTEKAISIADQRFYDARGKPQMKR